MRLYLSSFRLGDDPGTFARMVGGARRGWLVANALDGVDEERRRRDSLREIEELERLGLVARDLDLRAHDRDSLVAAFGEPDFVWVRGGNVFTLRAAMARSGFDDLIVRALRQDRVAYGGYSAGACVLAPSLAGLERCDPVEECAAVSGPARFDGLGILDRPVVPHLDSPGHRETALLGEVAAAYDAAGQPYWALRDGQALVVDGTAVAVR